MWRYLGVIRCGSPQGGTPMMELVTLYGDEDTRAFSLCWVRIQPGDSYLQTRKKRTLTRHWGCQHLDLGFPRLKNHRFVVEATQSMLFTIGAWADQDSAHHGQLCSVPGPWWMERPLAGTLHGTELTKVYLSGVGKGKHPTGRRPDGLEAPSTISSRPRFPRVYYKEVTCPWLHSVAVWGSSPGCCWWRPDGDTPVQTEQAPGPSERGWWMWNSGSPGWKVYVSQLKNSCGNGVKPKNLGKTFQMLPCI